MGGWLWRDGWARQKQLLFSLQHHPPSPMQAPNHCQCSPWARRHDWPAMKLSEGTAKDRADLPHLYTSQDFICLVTNGPHHPPLQDAEGHLAAWSVQMSGVLWVRAGIPTDEQGSSGPRGQTPYSASWVSRALLSPPDLSFLPQGCSII